MAVRSTGEGTRFNRGRGSQGNSVLTGSPTPAQSAALEKLSDSSLVNILGGVSGVGHKANPLVRDVVEESRKRHSR